MAELFGVCSNASLDAKHADGLSKMGAALTRLRAGQQTIQKLDTCQITTLTRHDLERPEIHASGSMWGVWVGTSPRRTGHSLPDVMNAIASGKLDGLGELQPRFAAFVYEKQSHKSWLVTDAYGHVPLYINRDGPLVFCTKAFGAVKSGLITGEVCPEAVIDLLVFEYVTSGRTLAADLEVMPPASVLEYDGATRRIRSYAEHAANSPPYRSLGEAADELYQGLRSAVRRSIPNSGKVVVPLSGGMDSRALLHCARAEQATVSAVTFGLANSRDVVFARRVATAADVPHEVVEVDGRFLPKWHEHAIMATGGCVGAFHCQILSLGDALASNDRAILDGLSGDMLLGGHVKWKTIFSRNQEQAEQLAYRSHARSWASAEQRRSILNPEFARTTNYAPESTVARYFRDTANRELWRSFYAFDVWERQARFIQWGPHMLQPLAHVEAPFYDREVMRVIDRLPAMMLVEQRAYLAMYRRRMGDLAKYRDSLRSMPLSWPLAIRFMKKVYDFAGRRFPGPLRALGPQNEESTSYPTWLRGPLKDFVRSAVMDGSARLFEVLNRSEVERLLQEHFSGAANNTSQIGSILSLATWLRLCTD